MMQYLITFDSTMKTFYVTSGSISFKIFKLYLNLVEVNDLNSQNKFHAITKALV